MGVRVGISAKYRQGERTLHQAKIKHFNWSSVDTEIKKIKN
jgi:hypothetical protein